MGDEATWTPLHIAVAAGQVELVSAILKHSGGLNAADATGATPVHLCCQRKSWVCLNVLLHHGADANAVTEDGDTPLHTACQYNAVNCCRSLLLKGCSWTVKNYEGETPLHKCIAGRHAGCVVEVLRVAPAVGGCVDPELDWTYLHEAAVRNSALVLGLLHKAAPTVKLAVTGRLGLTAIHLAAMVDAYECVKYLLSQRAPGSLRDRHGGTPLHWACYAGSYESAHILIRHSAEMEATDGLGRTPLHVAAIYGRDACMKLMLQRGLNPLVKCGKMGRTPLHYAAAHGTVACVELLCTGAWACKVNAKDDRGMTPLYLAARTGDLATAVVLIKQGAALHAACHDGTTPLIMTCVNNSASITTLLTAGTTGTDPRLAVAMSWAARHGSLEVLRHLMGKGCDVGALSSEGLTLLMDAAWGGHADVFQYLLDTNAVSYSAAAPNTGETALIIAVKRGRRDVLRCLIKHVESIDNSPTPLLIVKDRRGYTPLHYAAIGGHPGILRDLLTYTAVPEPGAPKVSPFHCAARSGQVEALSLLYDAEPTDLTAHVDEKRATPLHWAAFYGETACVEYLADRCDVNAVDAGHQTALHKACAKGHDGAVAVLLAAGIDVRAKSVLGWEAVHHAAKASYDCLHRMLKTCSGWEAMLTSTTNTLQTPLHLAVKGGCVAAVQLLVESGANVEAADKEGLRAVEWAALDNATQDSALLHALAPHSKRHGTALHLAALAKKQDAVRYLMHCGWAPEVVDSDGRTAAHIAAGVGAVAVLSALPPSLLNAGDKAGCTPLHTAAAHGRTGVFETLFNDSHFEAADAEGKTFTHHAAAHGHLTLLKYLVEILGAAQNPTAHPCRMTPFLEASSGGHLPVVLYFLDLAARADKRGSEGGVTPGELRAARDADGNTALHLAALHGHSDVAHVLLKRGYFLSTTNMHGWTPVDCSTGENNPAISEQQKRSLCEVFRVWCDHNPEPSTVTHPLQAELQRFRFKDGKHMQKSPVPTIMLDPVFGGHSVSPPPGAAPRGPSAAGSSYTEQLNFMADAEIHQQDLMQGGAGGPIDGMAGPPGPHVMSPVQSLQAIEERDWQLLWTEEKSGRFDVERKWLTQSLNHHIEFQRQRAASFLTERAAADRETDAWREKHAERMRSSFRRDAVFRQLKLSLRTHLLGRYFRSLRLHAVAKQRTPNTGDEGAPVTPGTAAVHMSIPTAAADPLEGTDGFEVIEMNRTDLLERWIERLGDATYSTIHGLSAMQAACKYRRPEVVAVLLGKGVDPNFPKHDPPVFMCVAANSMDCLMLLCEDQRTRLGAVNDHGMRALEYAAHRRRYDMVDYLLSHKHFQHHPTCHPSAGVPGCVATVMQILAGRDPAAWSPLLPDDGPTLSGRDARPPSDSAGMEVLGTRIRQKLYLLEDHPDRFDTVYLRFAEALATHATTEQADADGAASLSLDFLRAVDANERTERGKTLLQVAAEQGYAAQVLKDVLACAETQGLLEDFVTSTDQDGNNVLHSTLVVAADTAPPPHGSAVDGFVALVEMLRNFYSDQVTGRSMFSCNVFATLLEAQNARQETVVHLAAGLTDVRCLRTLAAHPATREYTAAAAATADALGLLPMHRAARAGHLHEAFDILTPSSDAGINAGDAGVLKHPPLLYAVNAEQAGTVACLLERGAEAPPNTSPLHLAAESGSAAVLHALLSGGCDPTTVHGAAKDTPLHAVAASDSVGCASALLAAAPGLATAQDAAGNTPLHFACLMEAQGVVRVLLASGACPGTANRVGNTPLHNACLGQNVEIVKMLLATGVDTAVEGAFGTTPLQATVIQPDPPSLYISAVRFVLAGNVEPQIVAAEFRGTHGQPFEAEVHSEEQDGHTTTYVFAAPQLVASWRSPMVADVDTVHVLRGGTWVLSEDSSTRLLPAACPDRLGMSESASSAASGSLNKKNRDSLAQSQGDHPQYFYNRIASLFAYENTDAELATDSGEPRLSLDGHTLCTRAIRFRRQVGLRQLLALKVSPSEPDADGNNAYHVACILGDAASLTILLQSRWPGVNAFNNAQCTPLHESIKAGTADCLNLLTENSGVDLNAHLINDAEEDITPTHQAVIKGDVTAMEQLVAAGATDIPTQSWGSMLHCALEHRVDASLHWLLQHDRSPQQPVNNEGATVMHFAAKEPLCLPQLKLLVRHGGKLHEPLTEDGYSPFHVACAHGNMDVLQYAMDIQDNHVWLAGREMGTGVPLLAVLHKRLDGLLTTLFTTAPFKDCQELWQSLDCPDAFGYTPFYTAVSEGYHREVKVLLEVGARPSKMQGATVVHLASTRERCLPTLQYLLAHYTDGAVGVPSVRGALPPPDTPPEKLFSLGDVDDEGLSPLHYACRYEAVRCAALLLQSGAAIDARHPPLSHTPAMTATSNGSEKCLRYLLRRGADRNATNEHDETAASIAVKLEYPYMLWLIQKVAAETDLP